MFLKNDLQPAVATASAQSVGNANRQKQNDAFQFAGASEHADFNHYSQNAGNDDMRRRSQPRQNPNAPTQKSRKNKPSKMMIIGIAVAVIVVALLVLILALAITSDKHITYTNNAYIAYADGTDYYVSANGKVLEHKFEGDVSVIPSADRSFAYIEEVTADGVNLYLLEGRSLKQITISPITEVLAYASLEPGAVWCKDNKFYFYSEKVGETYLGKDNIQKGNCLISGDAETVVYTKEDKANAAENDLFLYTKGSEEKLTSNCTPVAVSNYGDYVYVTPLEENSLYYVTAKKKEQLPVEGSSDFAAILMMNRKGDEIIFATKNSSDAISTSIFRLKKKTTSAMASSLLTVAPVDPSIAIYDTFANTYFTGTITNEQGQIAHPTYHLSKKYECNKISSFSGQFSQDGDYFYYIKYSDSEEFGDLIQMDLNDENRTKVSIFEDVKDFAVTEKGNVYALNSDDELRFYKRSANKKTPLSHEAEKISFYSYANKLYFSEFNDSDVSVYFSEEGSDKEIAKFGKTQISNVPTFTQPNSKKTYVYFYSVDDNALMLFYTSNGKSFELISKNCNGISGVEIDYN